MNEMSSLPLEDFIQAITSQLDRTQQTMALKAKAGLPLTFAVKDLSLDLRAHLDMQGGAVTIRPAGPGDGDASTLHLELTTITKPMIEENTRNLEAAQTSPTIRDVLGDDLTEEEERRLEWVGIQDVEQLREVQRSGGNRLVEKVARRPIDKLRLALESASEPHLDRAEPIIPERTRPEPPHDREPWQPEPPRRPDEPTRIRRAEDDLVRRRLERLERPEPPRPPDELRPGAPVIRERILRPSIEPIHRGEHVRVAPRLELTGENLRGTSGQPIARIDATPVPIVELADDRVVVQPLAHQTRGTVEIETDRGTASIDYDEDVDLDTPHDTGEADR